MNANAQKQKCCRIIAGKLPSSKAGHSQRECCSPFGAHCSNFQPIYFDRSVMEAPCKRCNWSFQSPRATMPPCFQNVRFLYPQRVCGQLSEGETDQGGKEELFKPAGSYSSQQHQENIK
ncbi:hypothetical protein AVEN_90844-1 [Araneus ventricosus]|uniref:Uncharacterized protein n=1 Tax=Araneus ventricosus TaxID=182803 RepID=A0A4Y2FV21_ARAVE|nr:hypothetical protein AVEN_33008-1 [Araneus ventricosus]GBM45360.1 hypothetical protein AVEN_90844-1 [Araneus ventricosus]